MRRMRRTGETLLALLLAGGAGGTAAIATGGVGNAATVPGMASAGRIADPLQARSDYVENCGGCHGIQGDSAPALLPVLKGRVGWFMCTPEARAYLVRLPNVAHSRITDNAELADLLNYVVFTLGAASTPAGAPPFTAAEVTRERPHALNDVSLIRLRARLVDQVVRACRAPASLRALYPIRPGATP